MESHLDSSPPQYPGPNPLCSVTQFTHGHLPSFDDVMALYEYEDSIRLPGYQARPLRRYHPYCRILPVTPPAIDDGSRYYNTIYDEEYVELDVPSLLPPIGGVPVPYQVANPVAPSTALPTEQIEDDMQETADQFETLAVIHPSAHVQDGEDEALNLEEQHCQQIHQVRYSIPEFISAVTHASPPQEVECPATPPAEDAEPALVPPSPPAASGA